MVTVNGGMDAVRIAAVLLPLLTCWDPRNVQVSPSPLVSLIVAGARCGDQRDQDGSPDGDRQKSR